LDNI